MSWWGKIIGGAFGFMLGGPLGALFGTALGHNIDRGLDRGLRRTAFERRGVDFDDRERTQTAFFTATFAVMGRLAKADGHVTRDEIQSAEALMDQMGLNPELKRVAQNLFNQGKQADFDLDELLDQFRQECHRRRSLMRIFIELQLQAAYADGFLHPDERQLLLHVCETLGFTRFEFNVLEAMVRAEQHFRRMASARPERAGIRLQDAYALLNVKPSAKPAEIKRAYRRLISQHHPDKLVSKGLPEEMLKVATQKTQEIKAAYETVREARGF